MYKVDLPLDQYIEKAAERRRSAETARKARIFNTRLRVMGLDTEALNQQVQEKKQKQNMEIQRDKAYDQLRKTHDEVLLQQEAVEKERRAALQTDLAQCWATQQRVEDSSDADLKCGLKGAFRITIPEAELGPASMQIFQGEGAGEKERRREQQRQTEKDLRAQKEENRRRCMREKHRETLMSKELMYEDLRGVRRQTQEEECKKAARVALDNYNQALAAERAQNLKEQLRRDERESLEEVWHTLTSDMMTECEAAERQGADGKLPQVQVDKWKGMRPEQLSAIYREREEQRLQKKRQSDTEKAQTAAWEKQLLKLSREAEEEERRAAQLRREKRIQTDLDNMQLAREQQAHQDYLNRKLYTNRPTKEYFHQFNTSSR